MLGSDRHWHEWEWHGQRDRHYSWVPDRAAFLSMCERHAWEGDLTVGLVPLLDPADRMWLSRSSVLWCRVEDGKALARLERFRVPPTLVLQEGSTLKRTALWALRKPLSVQDCEKANARLSYAIGTKRKTGRADFRVHVPGTVLRSGRSRPIPVVVAGGSRELYPAGVVVKRLKDPPPPREWWNPAA